ncbi:helix-turn-helix domain-containing protein [Bacillus sp. FJAT-28004]|uniref:helix-turn-helix domain-containing protein n=1 Tax=Bacillus sp. FJAT-28004 TaxID=1679165 RepID=UPI0006B59A8D|nr:helix-turn-helix transcriptional regulator [Bacillus sp. FJAT-28004]
MSLGTKIHALRKEKGWSAEYLGELSGCTQSTISEIERDKRSPHVDTLIKIASAFDLTLIDILPFEMKPSKLKLNSQENELISLFHKLSSEQRDIFIELMKSMIDKK